MIYDIVIPFKLSEPNLDLRYTLRSIEKFGGSVGTIWLVGDCPYWARNVRHIKVEQTGNKWENSLKNRIEACKSSEVSETFLLFNDDFFLTKPVTDWDDFTNINRGLLLDCALELESLGVKLSNWQKGFRRNYEVLTELGIENPICYELHAPMLIRKKCFLETYEKGILEKFDMNGTMFFHRTIYGNLYPRTDINGSRRIEDSKPKYDIPDESYVYRNGYFSVKNRVTCLPQKYPKICGWLERVLGEPCKYENPLFK